MKNSCPIAIVCNGADEPNGDPNGRTTLEYRRNQAAAQNVMLKLPAFVRSTGHLSNRTLDLLEFAAYIFAADRLTSRGDKEAVEYQSWSRCFHLTVKVRDYEFWRRREVQETLNSALSFMTGDESYDLSFQPGHATPVEDLFDREEFRIEAAKPTSVLLFSGGLDSLAGALECLKEPGRDVCLVSHRSQPGTIRTQDKLVEALSCRYPQRVTHYKFHCTLKGLRAPEESQRSRAFLYCAIAYALSTAYRQNEFLVFENGVTSMNLPRRQDLLNARASRTTHPKTIRLMEALFSQIEEQQFTIRTPFLWKTKADAFRGILDSGHQDLISSAVSCSRTYQKLGQATHCGGCYQCIDRRFGAHAAEMEEVDQSGLYANDFISEKIESPDTPTVLMDYVRQAKEFAESNVGYFERLTLASLSDIVDSVSTETEFDAVNRIWDVHRRWGAEVSTAIKRMCSTGNNPYRETPEGSFLRMVELKPYLRSPVRLFAEEVGTILDRAIGLAYANRKPNDERELNDLVESILNSRKREFTREYPTVSYATSKATPDHSAVNADLVIETKYMRKKTAISKITDQLAADAVKYPGTKHLLMLVYDPFHRIRDETSFRAAFESSGRCSVCIVRG